ncbi:hypothetical protein BKH24_07900 [Actinomyces oris]|uniref:hypothetical protein n=1 Tax=Actinomyces oris TaxID=544580 RepID=UPI00094C66A0|nr:hypothetical protein [Actinomyces oris]OLO59500.1 hypothetical protein BKH24_07900 [Actinomyces oris]
MGNELVAEVKESETVWTGSRLLEDGADLKEAFESKSWVAGGLATAATAADAAAAAIDPLGEALSAGVGWVIEHLSPLKDWLNELAGDSDAVAAAASTWTNIATKLNSCASDLDKVRSSRLAGQESLAVATFKTLQAGSASHLRMTGGVAGAISSGLTVASVIVRMVHDMVRDAISDVIGKLLSKASITVLTAGVAAPWAVSSIATDVSSWATRLAKEVTDVVTSAKNLKGLLSKANRLFDDVGEKFAGMVAMALGYGSKNADNAAKGAKHADDAADAAKGAKHADDAANAAKGADGAVPSGKGGGGEGTPPGKGGGGGTPPGKGGGGDDPVKKSQEAHERARTAKNELPAGNEQKTTSSDHVKTLSGWSKDRPDGFQEPNVNDVLAKQEEIGHPIKRSGCRDHGVDGQQLASHAERQLSLTAKEPYIGVSKKVCSDCRGYFSKLAQHEGRDWYVTDPHETLIFRADGSVDSLN